MSAAADVWCVHCREAITGTRLWYWPWDGTCAEVLHPQCVRAWLARVGEARVVRLGAPEETS